LGTGVRGEPYGEGSSSFHDTAIPLCKRWPGLRFRALRWRRILARLVSSSVAWLDRIWYKELGMSADRATNEADRPLEFIASSKDDLSSFPPEVKFVTGYALRQIQQAKDHPDAKPMKGNLRDVIEITVDDDSGDRTYRTTCTTRIGNVVYVLHAFQKKATSGISTPKRELDLIEQRLKTARKHYEEHYGKKRR
jgi:phage-related protein